MENKEKRRVTKPTSARIILMLLVHSALTPHKMWKLSKMSYEPMFSATCKHLKLKILDSKKTRKGKIYWLKKGDEFQKYVSREFRKFIEKWQSMIKKHYLRHSNPQPVGTITEEDAVAVYNCLLLPEFGTFLKYTYLSEKPKKRIKDVKSLFEPVEEFLDLHDSDDLNKQSYWIKFFTDKLNSDLLKEDVASFDAIKAESVIKEAQKSFSKKFFSHSAQSVMYCSKSKRKELEKRKQEEP